MFLVLLSSNDLLICFWLKDSFVDLKICISDVVCYFECLLVIIKLIVNLFVS